MDPNPSSRGHEEKILAAAEKQPSHTEMGHSSLGSVRTEFSEAAVGICSFANDAKGFKGILKQVIPLFFPFHFDLR
jgi:hypothetical protein